MKIELKTSKVYQGSVYPAGSELDVPNELARTWIDAGDAQVVAASKVVSFEKKEGAVNAKTSDQ